MGMDKTGVTTPQGNTVGYFHIFSAQHYYRDSIIDVQLRGYNDYAGKVAGNVSDRIANIRIEGGDYVANMTLAQMYAHVKTLVAGDGIDWTTGVTDRDPD